MQFTNTPPVANRRPFVTDDEAAALSRATVNLFGSWGLGDVEARTLLGNLPQRTWARWKVGDIDQVDRDQRDRMAILIGIHKALRQLFTDPSRGYAWIRKPNNAFEGKSAIDVMAQGGTAGLIDVHTYLVAELGAR